MGLFHLARRKLATFAATVRACDNWPQITLAKLNLGGANTELKFRNGLRLQPVPPLRATWGEIFEPAIADLYGIRASKPDLIVDVGANMGAFSCFAAHAHPGALVHAFEPSPAHADMLEANVAVNRLPNVILHRDAVTKDGRDVVFSTIGAGGSSGIFLQGDGPSTHLKSVSLDCIDFSNARSLFIKLDCEGAEGEIIGWICTNLGRLPPQITLACEYHHWCPIPLDQALDMLRAHGFQAERRTLFDEPYVFAGRG